MQCGSFLRQYRVDVKLRQKKGGYAFYTCPNLIPHMVGQAERGISPPKD